MIEKCVVDLVCVFDFGDVLSCVVFDYLVGMMKKIMLVGVMIYLLWVLVFDEFFEFVDLVLFVVIFDIFCVYVLYGGIVIFFSYGMDLVEWVCFCVVIIVGGEVFVEGMIDEVCVG